MNHPTKTRLSRREAVRDALSLQTLTAQLEARLAQIHFTATRSKVRWWRRMIPGSRARARLALIIRLTEQWKVAVGGAETQGKGA